MMYSNCLIEALKAKLKDPKNVHIHLIPPAINNYNFHFYWINREENTVYHYSEQNKSFFGKFNFLFKGKLKSRWVISFEELMYKKMKSKGWSTKKQIKYAKKLGFVRPEPFEIDRSEY